MQAKIDALAKTGAKEIVMMHDDCYGAYTTKALEYGIEVPFKITHYIEYLRNYVRDNKDKVSPLNMKIAYQKPCSSHYTPWIEKDLDELFQLIGVERVARKYDRKNPLCCGSPVSPHIGNQKGENYKQMNINDAIAHKAEAMVFMCQYCDLQMRDEVAQAGLTPIFLTNLVRMALGEKLSEHPAGLGDSREPIQMAVQIVKGLL